MRGYFYMYEKEFDRISKAAMSNSLTFFVGAGVSRLSGAPGWAGLINTICRKMNIPTKNDYSSEEYLKIPQMYYYSLSNKSEYYKTVENEIGTANILPNTVHKEMLSLNPTSFITTNYDSLLEDAACKYCQMFKVVSRDNDVPNISGDRFILKIHGDFKNKNFVLKEEDYLNYSEHFKLIETILKSLFSTNTIVFIGYRLGDYNVKLILNWAKELLKGDFREPIFLYTDDEELSQMELKYQESKGVTVLEWQKLNNNASDYTERYKAFFDAIKKNDYLNAEGKVSEEAFKTLYYMLEPLNMIKALRYEDISRRMAQSTIIIESGGLIRILEDNPLFDRFIEIDKMDQEQRNHLDEETVRMYQVIKSVLKKACIYGIFDNHVSYTLTYSDIEFADEHCLLFDYVWMNKYVKKQYKALPQNYNKAFYLYKLSRFDEALDLFIDVSRQAFKQENYVLYYFAKANCINLRKIVKNARMLGNFEEPEDDIPNDIQTKEIFRSLPFEFRTKYASLEDIHSNNLLYKYAYYAFDSAQKVEEIIDTNTIEYGVAASDKAIYRINDYLHFLQGNGLVVDAFTEYKKSVKRIMEALVRKYSIQNKHEVYMENMFPTNQTEVRFDILDFFSFVECFYDKEIARLFSQNSIETIEFTDKDKIEQAVKNIIEYYQVAIGEQAKYIELIYLQTKIKRVLVLLRYVDISQELVEYICSFILSNEFREIQINDKILFLDRQIYRRGKSSKKTVKIVENALFTYMDNHKAALDAGSQYNVYSTVTNINYNNLANYLLIGDKEYISRGLSRRVATILESNQLEMFFGDYYSHIGRNMRQKLVLCIESKIEKEFDFNMLKLLFAYNYKIKDTVNKQLMSFLREERINDEKPSNKAYISYPKRKKYESIIQVGYWCFLGLADKSAYSEFQGVCDEFDFYYNFKEFEYSKFDVRWLLFMHKTAIKRMASVKRIKNVVRQCIAQSIKTNNFTPTDNDKLKDILVNYFC